MSDDYPSEDTLARIRTWPLADLAGCLDFVATEWHWPEFGVSRELTAHEGYVVHADKEARYLRLATGGWSGNEDIIGAMNENVMLRAVCWQLTARGGLHIWRYPDVAAGGR